MTRQAKLPESTIELLNVAKGVETDQHLALRLGAERPIISKWRLRKHVGADYAVRLAELANVDVKHALALCAAESIQNVDLKNRVIAQLQKGFVQISMLAGLAGASAMGQLLFM
ncbi:MAG: hypothetical protein V4695_07270 [Pseudomonadota bacterium]